MRARQARAFCTPEIEVQALALSSNEFDFDLIAHLARERGADTFRLKLPSMPAGTDERHEHYLARNSKLRLYDARGQLRTRPTHNEGGFDCPSVYLEPGIVCWDGRIAVCCRDVSAEVLSARFRPGTNFQSIWDGEELVSLRRALASRVFPLSICTDCPLVGRSDLIFSKRSLTGQGGDHAGS